MLHESPPEAILALVDHHGLNGLPVLLATATDLDLEGQFRKHWLVVNERFLSVIGDEPRPQLLRSLPLAEVESFRAHGGGGSGILQARVDGIWVDLLRYSNALAGRYARAAGKLEELRTTGVLSLSADDNRDDCRCPGCGLALQFAGDVCPRCLDRGAVLGRVWSFLQPYRGPALLLCLLTLLSVAAELAPPKLQEYLVDHVLRIGSASDRTSDLVTALLAIVGCLAGTRLMLAVANAIKGIIANRVGTRMTAALRAQLVAKLQQLSVDYYDRHPVGVLMSRVAHDTEALYGLVHQLTGGFLMQILQLLGVGLMLFTLNAKLALWTLIPMPFVLYGSWFFWRHVYPKYYRYWDSASKQAAALAGMLSGIRVVKAFAQEGREFDRFQATSQSLCGSRLEVEVSAATFSAVMQLVFSLGGLIVWFVGGRDVLNGQMTLGALMAFLAYLAIFYSPLSTLAQLTTWLTSFLTASQRVFELLDTTARISEPEQPASLPRMRGQVRFENVTFGYDRNHPVLRNFSLTIRPGEMVGIVGRSGSGKTTLVNLLARFYDVDQGRVAIDATDVRSLSHEDLRRQVGVVLQEPFLFRGTVWENLVYGRPGASPEEAIAAAKGANAHDFILRLPFGYETHLGERGAGLSGGEKQRLSIARTLLYDPRILILDEATSSVDTESEKLIQDALTELTRGRTTIAIAHRLSTLQHADRILVMDHGKLVEQGSHEELLALDGLYARLVRIQTQLAAEPSVNGLVLATASTEPASWEPGQPEKRPARRSRGKEKRKGQWQSQDAEAGDTPAYQPRWLTPSGTRIRLGQHGSLEVATGSRVHGGVFAVRALPASWPRQFLSLRYADGDGQEHEVGLVRDLADWPTQVQDLLERSLARRYFIRRLVAIDSIEQKYGLLTFRVDTNLGPAEFTMRSSHSQAQDYGQAGKILIDVDDNRYLIEDVEALPRRQQLLFRRYIYW